MATTPPETTPARGAPTTVKTIEGVAGYAIGAAGLYWVLRDLRFSQFVHSLAGMNWGLLALSVTLPLAAYLCVGWQWLLMLRLVGPISFWRSTQAVFAGRFANDALPVHVGYIVRAFLAARWMGVGVTAVAPSLIVERLWDGFWLAVGAFALSVAVPLPVEITRARNIMAATVLGGAAAVAIVIWRHRHNSSDKAFPKAGVFARLQWFFARMAGGTSEIARSRVFAGVAILALARLALQAAAILIMLPACHISLSITDGLCVFMAAYLAACFPTTPGGAGIFQVLVVNILGYFGVGKVEAAAFSLVSFILTTLPLDAAGFFALAKSGMTLRQIRNRGEWRASDGGSRRAPIVD